MSEKKPETTFVFTISSLPGKGIKVVADVDLYSKGRDEIPESLKDLSPELQAQYLAKHFQQQEEWHRAAVALVQGLAAVYAQTQKRPEPPPDNVVQGPWARPWGTCTHPGCTLPTYSTLAGYPFCSKHWADAVATLGRENEEAAADDDETPPEEPSCDN